VLLLDGEGKERARLEGYLPNNDFNAALRNGLGRIALFTRNTPMRNDGTAMSSSLWEFAFCTGGDVLAGCGALQGHERSRRTGQSRRGTSNHISVQPVDEQVHSVVALIRIDPLAKIDSQELPI